MNKISVFEHPEFGRIRTLDIDGKIWFCASDIASALGYANPRDAVARHCKPIGVAIYDTPTPVSYTHLDVYKRQDWYLDSLSHQYISFA